MVTYVLLAAGVIVLGGEFFLVRWYPGHKQRATEAALKLLPYHNDGLGVRMKVAAALYGKVEIYPGGVRIYRPALIESGPSLTLTLEPNTGGESQFSPQTLAAWETSGASKDLSGFEFQHQTINNRDAALIWEYVAQTHAMQLTARIIAPDRILKAVCETGSSNRNLYMRACDETVQTINLTGAPSTLTSPKQISIHSVH